MRIKDGCAGSFRTKEWINSKSGLQKIEAFMNAQHSSTMNCCNIIMATPLWYNALCLCKLYTGWRRNLLGPLNRVYNRVWISSYVSLCAVHWALPLSIPFELLLLCDSSGNGTSFCAFVFISYTNRQNHPSSCVLSI